MIKIKSIRWRLFAAFAGVALIAVAIVGALAATGTRGEFRTYVARTGMGMMMGGQGMLGRQAVAIMTDNYIENGGWNDAQSAVDLVSSSLSTRAAIADTNGKVIAGSADDLDFGRLIPHPLYIEDRWVGTAYIEPPSGRGMMGAGSLVQQTPEGDYLASVSRYLFWAAGLAGIAALGLAFLFSKQITKPVSEITNTVEKMTGGDLGARAVVKGADELTRLGSAVNSMAGQLQKNEELRKSMIADVAHELRTPITTLQGYLEGFKDGVVQPTDEAMDSLYQETIALGELVRDLQELSLADAGELRLSKQKLDLNSLLDGLVERFMPRFEEKGLALEIRLADDFPLLTADELRLAQVFKNLLENAFRYTERGDSVSVRTERSPEGATVRISDTGHGIEKEALPFVFERFYRGDQSRSRKSGGTGLGLAVARKLVEAHGGMISADSEAGKGTTMTVYFPSRIFASSQAYS
ncbi:MAG: HAMP domain-containing sensor histidine kinase [Candidatus Aquicultorales bacterium]